MLLRHPPNVLPRAWPIAGGRMTVGLVIARLAGAGAARQVYELARGLDRARHDVRVYALSDAVEPYGTRLEAVGIPVTSFTRHHSWEPSRLLALARAFRHDRVDLVHGILPAGIIYGVLAARLARVVTTIASMRAGARAALGTTGYLLARAERSATAVLANDPALADRLAREAGVRPERIRVVRDGVDASRFPAPRRLDDLRGRVLSRPPVVGLAGAVADAPLLGLAERLHARQPAARFVWMGGARERDAIEAAARSHALPLTFADHDRDLERELPGCTVVWLAGPPREEAGGIALAAMAAGRPVLAVRGAGVDEVLDAQAGTLLDDGSPERLAAETLALLDDRPRRRELAQAGRARAATVFGLERALTETAALYEEALLGRVAVDGTAAAGVAPAAVTTTEPARE